MVLISASIFASCLHKHNRRLNEEKFNETSESLAAGSQAGATLFFIIIAIIVLIIEIFLLFYLLTGAIYCTAPGGERALHIILIIFFTFPYALLTAFFGNDCVKKIFQKNQLYPEGQFSYK